MAIKKPAVRKTAAKKNTVKKVKPKKGLSKKDALLADIKNISSIVLEMQANIAKLHKGVKEMKTSVGAQIESCQDKINEIKRLIEKTEGKAS